MLLYCIDDGREYNSWCSSASVFSSFLRSLGRKSLVKAVLPVARSFQKCDLSVVYIEVPETSFTPVADVRSNKRKAAQQNKGFNSKILYTTSTTMASLRCLAVVRRSLIGRSFHTTALRQGGSPPLPPFKRSPPKWETVRR